MQQTKGLVFGDSVEEGIVRDNRFMHKDLGISLSFPPGWNIKNSTTQLFALSPKIDAAIQLKIDDKPSGNVTEYTRRVLGNNGNIETLEIEKLHAAIGSTDKIVLGVVYFDRKAFHIEGNAKTPATLEAQRNTMKDTIRSFHVLTDDEKKAIKPLTIKLIAARKGDTYAKLAQRSPLGKNAESYLRLINEQYPRGEPAAGQPLKIVE